jgi:poly-gamma-glutamate synthesis protein (capsule biosynthesis protein)
LGINAVSLANNHTLNNGAKGLANTKKVLPENGIAYIGQDAVFNDESVKTFENGGNIKLSVITIDCLNTNDDITPTIKKQKDLGNKVLIFPHWGTEYEQTHSFSQEKLAHAWIDAGADFVFGGHPHVIQDAELYKGKPIFYSMGNLLFDQDFSPETQRGLVVAVKINPDGVQLVLLPTISKSYQPQLLSGTEKTNFLSKFRKYLGAPEMIEKNYGYDTINLSIK